MRPKDNLLLDVGLEHRHFLNFLKKTIYVALFSVRQVEALPILASRSMHEGGANVNDNKKAYF
jgi:hypothetical protein